MVIQGVIQSNHLVIACLAIFTAILTTIYLLRLFTLVFLGEPRDASIHAHHEGTPVMVWVVVASAALSLAAGFLVKYPMDLVGVALTDILGNPTVQGILGQ